MRGNWRSVASVLLNFDMLHVRVAVDRYLPIPSDSGPRSGSALRSLLSPRLSDYPNPLVATANGPSAVIQLPPGPCCKGFYRFP